MRDPREFLLEISGRSSDPIKVVVKYFACDDAETFCVPVTQEYLVSFERDLDGGNRRSFGNRGAGIEGPTGPVNDRVAEMMRRMPLLVALDIDQDGVLSASELERAPQSLRKLDQDADGEISPGELRPVPSGRRVGSPPEGAASRATGRSLVAPAIVRYLDPR